MKADTFVEFEKINRRIDVLERKIDILTRGLVTDEQLRKITADINAESAKLATALNPQT